FQLLTNTLPELFTGIERTKKMSLQRVLLPGVPAIVCFFAVQHTLVQQGTEGIQHGVTVFLTESCFGQLFTRLRHQLTGTAIQGLTILNRLPATQLADHQPAGIKNLFSPGDNRFIHVRSTAKSSSFTSPSDAGV